MATTTNYGWETPDDTDLVKDGAAAIRTLGNSVDTTTKALNPSTTLGDIEYRSSTSNTNARLGIGSAGQVLTVASGVPSWATPTTGDVTEVQAGTGVSVASGTGPIPVVTNTMATAIDAKGDLVVGTGADAFARLAVGASNGMVLTVDSAEATGLKYATPASGSTFVGCSATDSGDQNISNTTSTVVTWNTESFDTDAFHSTSTNTGRLTIPTGKTGYYQINARARWDENASNQRTIWVQKNGTTDVSRMDTTPSTNYPGSTQSFIVYLSAGDYIQMIAYQESGGTRLLRKTGAAGVFDIFFIGA